jgi:hypothetical protein
VRARASRELLERVVTGEARHFAGAADAGPSALGVAEAGGGAALPCGADPCADDRADADELADADARADRSP